MFTLLIQSWGVKRFAAVLAWSEIMINSTSIIDKSTPSIANVNISDSRYSVRLARSSSEIESALRLRFEVFKCELSSGDIEPGSSRLEFDAYDFKCDHLIVVDNASDKTVGTYRLNSIESAINSRGFYSYNEFCIEDLPEDVLRNGIEIGRACIDQTHRNTKVLFLLWKGLANYLKQAGKQYFFGCCSIFSDDVSTGAQAYRKLLNDGCLHENLWIKPRQNAISLDSEAIDDRTVVELPNLFNMYLRMGTKVCGPPIIDREFGTIDFFVVFDVENMNEKYRKLFFS